LSAFLTILPVSQGTSNVGGSFNYGGRYREVVDQLREIAGC
jgi:hypothetical protein